jgi:arsenical pump membrane protein
VAVASNLTNNLPAGLIAGSAATAANLPRQVIGALLIGVDLGPNLSITGSLATILWLAALRREGHEVSVWKFLRMGLVVMPRALVLGLGTFVLLQMR